MRASGYLRVRRRRHRRRFTPPGRIPIRRARSVRPTARSTSTGSSTATSGSARPRRTTTSSCDKPHQRAQTGRRRRQARGAARGRRRPRRPVRRRGAARARRARRAPASARRGRRRGAAPRAEPTRRRRRPAPPAALRRQARTARSRSRLDEEVAPPRSSDDGGDRGRRRPRRPRRSRPPSRAAPIPAARAVAERWFKALAGGDAAALTSLAALPFKTSGKDVTEARGADRDVDRPGGRGEVGARAHAVELFTTAGLRAAIGKLPANVDDGSGTQLYALASSGPRDTLILILAKRGTRLAARRPRPALAAAAPVSWVRRRAGERAEVARAAARRSSRSSRAAAKQPAFSVRWSSSSRCR